MGKWLLCFPSFYILSTTFKVKVYKVLFGVILLGNDDFEPNRRGISSLAFNGRAHSKYCFDFLTVGK